MRSAKLTGAPRFFGADSPSRVLVATADTVAMLDLANSSIEALATTSAKTGGRLIPDAAAGNRRYIAYAVKLASSSGSQIRILDLSTDLVIKDRSPILESTPKKLEWMADGRLAILQENGTLSLYSPSNNVSDAITDDAQDFVFLGDASRVAVLEKYAVEIFSFLPNYKERDYRRFALKNNMNISRLVWFGDEQHLLVGYPDSVYLLDLNDRHLDYYEKLVDSSIWQYDSATNTLFFLSGQELHRLEFAK
jgi:hypothetical protein